MVAIMGEETNMNLKVLELFSGIGGMHYALKSSQITHEVKLAIDINDVANKVYKHNFPHHRVESKNIQGLTDKFIHKLDVNAILMSPPCQPFTRNGKFGDLEDSRTDPFTLICDLIPKLPEIEFILMENVMGFDKSKAREKYLEVLKNAGFEFHEYLLSPKIIGIPNSRLRYYCVARRKPFSNLEAKDQILTTIPNSKSTLNEIKTYLEENVPERYLLNDKLLQTRYKVFDVVVPESKNSMCFTKAYTHYHEGTGSIFSPTDSEMVHTCFSKATTGDWEALKKLNLRFFTPREVARFLSFPDDQFSFPEEVTDKQSYRLLGNSINVAVVGELIRIMTQ